jgi:hypothetical protein
MSPVDQLFAELAATLIAAAVTLTVAVWFDDAR